MKILTLVDKKGSAIDRMANYTKRVLTQHNIRVCDLHPKRPNEDQIKRAENALKWCDIIDVQYWRSGEMLESLFGFARKPVMLTHHNPYDLDKHAWQQYKKNVVFNKFQQSSINAVTELIPHPVDVYYWQYNNEWKPGRKVMMVAARIEGKKGVLEVAQACQKIGAEMILVGRPSDRNYLNECLKYPINFYQDVSDKELRQLYYQSTIHVCNSIDNFESGTLPILESMACGTPVLSRPIGHVPDINNGRNLILNRKATGDVDHLADLLQNALENPDGLEQMRQAAWDTVKDRNIQLFGWKFNRLFHKIASKEPLVSIVVPTADNPDRLSKTLGSVMAAYWPNKEIVVVDDSENMTHRAANRMMIDELVKEGHTIKYIAVVKFAGSGTESHEGGSGYYNKDYGLPRARNVGARESQGQFVLFVDDRLKIEVDSIKAFMDRAQGGAWMWGVKDNKPKSFVENFSFISRETFIRLGGFNGDWITQYGGTTQEIRTRAEKNNVKLLFVEDARANQHTRASSKNGRRMKIALSKTQCYKLDQA